MIILTEPTPNPEALKFIPQAKLIPAGSWSFERTGFQPDRSPLARRIFAAAEVRRVYVAPDFLTATRDAEGPHWDRLRYLVIAAIADHIESGEPAVTEAPPEEPQDEGIEADIRQVLELGVRPGVAKDGGEVLFDRFDAETGVLWIRMQGACGGCPSSRQTLKGGIERIVRRYVPEVLSVQETPSASPQPGPAAKVARWMAQLGESGGEGARTVFSYRGREARRRSPSEA